VQFPPGGSAHIPRVPLLAIYRDSAVPQRQIGTHAVVPSVLNLLGLFHPETEPDPRLTPPTPPTLGATVAGILSGDRRWGMTISDAFGESGILEIAGRAQVSAPGATLSNEAQTLNGLPTGVDVTLYRTFDGGTRLRFRKFLPANASSSFVDGLADDPTAPDSALGDDGPPGDWAARTMEFVALAVMNIAAMGVVDQSGTLLQQATTNVREGRIVPRDARQLLVYPLALDLQTRVSLVNGGPV
jgi:hypothetical protein